MLCALSAFSAPDLSGLFFFRIRDDDHIPRTKSYPIRQIICPSICYTEIVMKSLTNACTADFTVFSPEGRNAALKTAAQRQKKADGKGTAA